MHGSKIVFVSGGQLGFIMVLSGLSVRVCTSVSNLNLFYERMNQQRLSMLNPVKIQFFTHFHFSLGNFDIDTNSFVENFKRNMLLFL